MTEFLIRTVSRYPLRRLARPSAVLAFAVALAYLGGLWLVVMHHVEGGHERNEPGLVVHWLRDSTLALPMTVLAVWGGILLARRFIVRSGAERSPLLAGAVLAAVVAYVDSTLMGLMNPIHNSMFGASHGGHEPGFVAHMARDALLALSANLVIALVVAAALLRMRPWAPPQVKSWRAPKGSARRFALQGAVALVLLAPLAVAGREGAGIATAGAGAGSPCPANAPLKTFDVQAIDVDIPLNRFGNHDPNGKMYVLSSEVARVRAQEQSGHVSLGLRNDAIQPLAIRANMGDCVEINFTNNATGGAYGVHIDGLAFDMASSGDAIGNNPSSAVANGASRTYRYYIPNDKRLEGAHYMRPGPGHREQVAHGLFGALAVEPPGSTYTNMITGDPIESGWMASIKPASGMAFREYVQMYHEIGNEKFDIPFRGGGKLPTVDPHTTAYRPGSRAMNYRSEPFFNRLNRNPKGDSNAYGSYTFGDPPVGIPRGYLGDPTKFRVMHTGSEMFHVYHLHGGGIRWRLNPAADPTFTYDDTGLNKHPKTQRSPSSRLDSQSIGPGESYSLEIEGGAGGVQQGAGEFLQHCHIGEHYLAGMWSFWRVYDTLQPDLKPLPDRPAPPAAVPSTGLVGKTMPDGTTITKDNLADWVTPQIPPQGARARDADGFTYDATVWDWKTQSTPDGPLFLGEPEEKSAYENYTTADDDARLPGHPSLLPVDQPVGADDRPKILFNPKNGRPAFPLMRTHVGDRPPFSPNLHSGAPWLGERGDTPSTGTGPQPWAGRPDGICPAGAPVRTFNVVGLELPIKVTASGGTDQFGKIYVLAKDVDDVLAGRKPAQPLAIRGNIGDCIAVTLVSRMTDAGAVGGFSKINMHIHHVQFDTQASDGVVSGYSFEQTVRPYKVDDSPLTADTAAGDTTIKLANVGKLHEGIGIAVGMGTADIEIRKIASIDTATKTVTLEKALEKAHTSGDYAGTEYVQSRWYPDVELDNIFWHNHVDGIHTWGQGLVGQFIVEPQGSTYHDPVTGDTVESGTYVDIHTNNPLAEGQVDGSFRELALWTIDENPVTDSTLNLRAAPWADRLAANPDPSLLFSSYTHGDPNTPLPRAYAGDPFVIRTISVSPQFDTLRIDGHRVYRDPRFTDAQGRAAGTPTDSVHYGVSEKYTLILDGGAGGKHQQPGDYLYHNGVGRRFRQGAWGLLRVLPRQVGDLQPLPGHAPPTGPFQQPTQTGGRPPEAGSAGDVCPDGVPTSQFDVSAVDVPGVVPGRTAAFVPTASAAGVKNGTVTPKPIVMHASAGRCIEVSFTNQRAGARASFHVGEVDRTPESSGVDVGYGPEQTVAPGETRTYRYYADTRKLGITPIADFGGLDTGTKGLYGALVISPAGATFTDPQSGADVLYGDQVDVHLAGSNGYRDFTSIMADDDPIIGGNFMPYPIAVAGQSFLNQRSTPLTGARGANPANAFSSIGNGDPSTPLLRAYAGDPVNTHFMVAPGSEQGHVFSLGGQSWPFDPEITNSNAVASQGISAWEGFDAELIGGAGGVSRSEGDYFYGDLRRPFTETGMWGIMRVMRDGSCPIRPLDGLTCTGQAPILNGTLPVGQRPGDPAVNPIEAPAPEPFAVTPGATIVRPAAGKGGGSTTTEPTGPRELRAKRRVTLAEFARRGLRIEVSTPNATKALELTLYRRSGRKLVKVRRTIFTMRRGGALEFRWKPGATVVRRFAPGSYVLRARVGPDRASLGGEVADAQLTLSRR